ncbi:MAG: RagB/SusD family nutrient uptake outer membrane protein [Candidatus Symbiothrix sp.]|jgi:hypothetical protein|nr:RagB/SusD family nutrient uptake outer membrane protein [Candidatus Symbiothrix sp.]
MKTILSALAAGLLLFTVPSCQDMLETDSNRAVFDDDYQLDDPDNSFYAISGILSKLQQIGDRYVLLGELRGDLMQATSIAPVSLQEVNNFQVSGGNEYASKYEYYDIINNCNYVLQHLDTAQIIRNEKLILRDYAEVKTIRAWTYFQLGLIFGEVAYFATPITDLEGSLKEYPVVQLEALAEILIEELKPYSGLPPIEASRTSNPFLSANLLLGDLYLFLNNYGEAASRYYTEMVNSRIVISDLYINRWGSSTFESVYISHPSAYLEEALARIRYSDDSKELHSRLVSLSYNDKPFIVPAQNYIDYMSSSGYFYSDNYTSGLIGYREADLRGYASEKQLQVGSAFYKLDSRYGPLIEKEMHVIYKFYASAYVSGTGSDPANTFLSDRDRLAYLTAIPLYRNPHLYLRFAEAVNRSGSPTLAYAVLKYGLTSANINDTAKVKRDEIGPYNFQLSDFDRNIPMSSRGRGYGVSVDTTVFKIPSFAGSANPRQDSILWVEDRILEEMSAETPFEGNRFFDLLRISRRRDNHPEFMANKVAAKYDDPEAMKARLKDMNNWYLP